MRFRPSFRQLLLVLLSLLIVGCGKVPLFSELDEEEANEVMAHLLQQKIECVKVAGKEGKWILQVPQDDFPLAMATLQAVGLPREKLVKMADVFQKSGLVSSPTEERIRFINALSQELSATLMKVDGVVAAKVHIALPDNDPLSNKTTPASAAVFIKYRAGYDVESSTPDLKNLITKSVEGLDFENVELVMSQAEMLPPAPKPAPKNTLAAWQAKFNLPPWSMHAASAGGGFLIALAAATFFKRKAA
jgi:type III secretion protein J